MIFIYHFKAIIFDLDGVITKTAKVHSAAWKKMFDDYLKQRADTKGERFQEFTHQHDYLPYVDGKPRYKGVESFLKSREIEIPYGDPSDSDDKETICGLGNRKNRYLNEVLEQQGVEVYESTIALIKELIAKEIKVGVASSSKNCQSVLQAANIEELFETRVDGIVSANLGLKGKPEPDIFQTACDNLKVPYNEAVIVEDAVSGVQAGFNGHFGLVLGIAREDNHHELKTNGADIVVSDLAEMSLNRIEAWFQEDLDQEGWHLEYYDYNPQKESVRESLCTIGNGYFGSRGGQVESSANGTNYPATYITGVYNNLASTIDGQTVYNEEIVNCPNWLPITFRYADENETWFELNEFLDKKHGSIKKYLRSIDFKTGINFRKILVEDKNGLKTQIISKRFASMENPHIALLEYHIIPINYSKKIEIKSVLDGSVTNSGVARYSSLNSQHLDLINMSSEKDLSFIYVKTNESNIKIAMASRISVLLDGKLQDVNIHSQLNKSQIETHTSVNLSQNQDLCITKIVSIYTDQNYDVVDPLYSAKKILQEFSDVDSIKRLEYLHKKQWRKIWNIMDIRISGDRFFQKILRLHAFHLIVSGSNYSTQFDTSIPARGLHGEAYRGHIFWDELFILPWYNLYFPQVSKSCILYRYNRLEGAKAIAKEHGCEGAMFPWQSGSDGSETTQKLHLNPKSGKWGPDFSYLQKHVSLAIAYNIWEYYSKTQDMLFLLNYGAPTLLEIAKFWTSAAQLDSKSNKFNISEVVGPDEFHEKIPGNDQPGLKNNAYTNIMVIWLLERCFSLLDMLDDFHRELILKQHHLTSKDISYWKEIKTKLNIPISKSGIIEQYEGYFKLKELDWDHYHQKYGDISRLDRILKAEGKSPNSYQVAKQADALMVFYLLSQDELITILHDFAGTTIDLKDEKSFHEFFKQNFEYYIQRTSHGSTLSRVVHAKLAEDLGLHSLGYKLYLQALSSDYIDIQGGTTGEGIHTGVMASTLYNFINIYAGLEIGTNSIKINPKLPDTIQKVETQFFYLNIKFEVQIESNSIKIKPNTKLKENLKIFIFGEEKFVLEGQWNEFRKK